MVELPRSRMRMMRPSSRFSAVRRSMRASTRSPCIASLMFAADTYTSGASPPALSGMTKPKPAACICRRPTTRSILSGSPTRPPLVCTSSPVVTSDFNSRRNVARSSCGILSAVVSSRGVAGCVTFSRISFNICSLESIRFDYNWFRVPVPVPNAEPERGTLNPLTKEDYLQVADIRRRWSCQDEIVQSLEECVRIVVGKKGVGIERLLLSPPDGCRI